MALDLVMKIILCGNKMNFATVCVVSVLIVQRSVASDEIVLQHEKEIYHFEVPLKRVLLCLDHTQLTKHVAIPRGTDLRFKLIDSFPALRIEFHPGNSCYRKIKENGYANPITAVITAKPLRLSSEIPTYFYDTPYLDDEYNANEEIPKFYFDVSPYEKTEEKIADVDAFPNGLFPLRDHWQSLKYVLSDFIMKHGWKRVAIVSDDSYYSQSFERKIEEHFRDTDLVFTKQSCVKTDRGCNFDRAMKFLRIHKASIIIANIQRANAEKLITAAQYNKLESNQHVWLVRDSPFEDAQIKIFNKMVSLTLLPYFPPNSGDGPYLNSVWRGLSLINRVIMEVKETSSHVYEMKRLDDYYKSIFKIMNDKNKCDRSRVFIRIFESGKLVYNHTTVVYINGRVDPYQQGSVLVDIPDWQDSCLVRSKSFKRPCDDIWVMIIGVVCLMFIVMAILLVFFFNRCLVWT